MVMILQCDIDQAKKFIDCFGMDEVHLLFAEHRELGGRMGYPAFEETVKRIYYAACHNAMSDGKVNGQIDIDLYKASKWFKLANILIDCYPFSKDLSRDEKHQKAT